MDPNLATALVGVAGAPVVVALVNAIVKPLTPDTRFYHPASIVFGVLWNLLLSVALVEAGASPRLMIANVIVLGILTGLAAAGLYSGISTEVQRQAKAAKAH